VEIMLKIRNLTSNRKFDGRQDINFWDNEIIRDLINLYKFKWLNQIDIIDELVDNYNRKTKQCKSDMAFIKQVKKLNKEGYFDA
jgi:hypothetical protein